MKKRNKVILTIFVVIVMALILLEATSRIYKCERLAENTTPPCLMDAFLSISEKDELILVDLGEKRLTGGKISKKEYRQAADIFILEIESEKLGYRNGISCGDYGYVRKDLPGEAKKFVRRHEFEHLLQTGEERNREFSANFAAGKEYPLGLIQTIFFSLKNRGKYYSSPACYILSLWKTFKIYFFPFGSREI